MSRTIHSLYDRKKVLHGGAANLFCKNWFVDWIHIYIEGFGGQHKNALDVTVKGGLIMARRSLLVVLALYIAVCQIVHGIVQALDNKLV
jgi:hypothetical protein